MRTPIPASLEIRIDVLGETQLRRRIDGILARLDDLSPALERIERLWRDHLREVFDTEGGATAGGRWAPLSPKYAAAKARHYPGAGILVRTGALRRSLVTPGAPGNIARIDRDSLVVGSELTTPGGRWYLGTLHQEGTREGLPRRRIIDLSEHVRQRMVGVLREHVRMER